MRFLLDEMFPAVAAQNLRDEFGHDAVHVGEVGLAGVADAEVSNTARAEKRAIVTESVADFAAELDLVIVCILKRNLPSRGAQAQALAAMLDRWATENQRPYIGQHWPT